MSRHSFLFPAMTFVLLGCSGSPSDPASDGVEPDAGSEPATCPLSAPAKVVVAETVDGLLMDSLWVAENSGLNHSAFALRVPEVEDANWLGVATLAFPCTEALWYDHYCEADGGISLATGGETTEEFFTTRNRCLRLGCEGPDIYVARVYFTEQPHEEADDRHVMSFPTTTVDGVATWDPNPSVTWIARPLGENGSSVSAEIEHSYRIDLGAGEVLDLAQSGKVEMQVEEHNLVLDLQLTFADLASAAPIEAAINIDGDTGGGTLRADGVTLGSWTGTSASGLSLTWEGECAE